MVGKEVGEVERNEKRIKEIGGEIRGGDKDEGKKKVEMKGKEDFKLIGNGGWDIRGKNVENEV